MRYIVKKGDTLYSISQKYQIPLNAILLANPIKNPNFIRAGTQLTLPTETDNPFKITINTRTNRLSLFSNNQLIKSYPVATGASATPSPKGTWKITKKALWGDPFGGYFMQLSVPYGTYGIHGTNKPWSIGKSVSHGCIRMYKQDIIELYNALPINTSVLIE